MPGILDFLTDVGGDRELACEFTTIVASPDCTQQDLLRFFSANNYADVTAAEVDKLLNQRENLKNEFSVPGNVDY